MLKMFRRIPVTLSLMAAAIANAYDPYLPSVAAIGNAPSMSVVDDIGNTITNNGAVAVTTYDGNAGYFNGAAKLELADSPDWVIGSGDATIEGWVFWDGTLPASGYITFWGQNPGGSSSMRLSIRDIYGTLAGYIDSDTNVINSSVAVPIKAWTHLAFVKSGTTYTLYVNGVPTGVKTWATPLPDLAASFFIGTEEGTSGYHKGFYDSIRFSKVARYTTNFTPAKLVMNSSDPYWNNTVLAINFETGVVDLKGHAITNTGVVSLGPGKFSNECLYFPGTAGGYATIASTPNTAFGPTDDFTVETWMKIPVLLPSGYVVPYANTTPSGFSFAITSIGFSVGRSLVATDQYFNVAIAENTWFHLAFIRKNGVLYCFYNGQLVGSPRSDSYNYVQGNVSLGCDGNLNSLFAKCYMYGLRITKGVARYPDNNYASIPVPTAAFPDYRAYDYYWDNTTSFITSNLVDLKARGYGYSAGVSVDSSIRLFGSPTIKYSGGSLQVNGNNQAVGTGNFTWESWVYPTVNNSSHCIFDNRIGSVNGIGLYTSVSGNGKLNVYNMTTALGIGSTVLLLNTWYHIAISKIGNTTYVFLNGKLEITFTDSSTHSATSFMYGNSVVGQTFSGNMSNTRYTSNVGRYKANFSIPTGPYPNPITGISDTYFDYVGLLIHGDTNTITDVTNKSVTANGLALLSNSYSRYSGKSLCIPAGNNNLTIPNSSTWDLSSSDGTAECWLYMPTLNSAQPTSFSPIMGQHQATNDGNWMVYVTGDGRLCVGKAGVNELSSAPGVVTTALWQHVAVVKSGTSTSLYLNGIRVATSASAYFNTSSNPLVIGGIANDSQPSAGTIYLNGIRFTKNIARYLNNFTLPSSRYAEQYIAPSLDLFKKYVTLHLDFEGNDGATSIMDKVSNLAFTMTGSASLSNSVSKTGQTGLSLVTGGYAASASAPSMLGAGEFVVEGWVKTNYTYGSYTLPIVCQYNDAGSAGTWSLGIRSGVVHFMDGTTDNAGTINISDNVWHHIALVRIGTTIYLYIDGVLDRSFTCSTNFNVSYAVQIGRFGTAAVPAGAQGFTLGVDDIRATKASRYKGGFIRPAYKLPLAA